MKPTLSYVTDKKEANTELCHRQRKEALTELCRIQRKEDHT